MWSVWRSLCTSVYVVWQGHPCFSVCSSHDSPGWHIHLCLFAKFDFKYLSHHTSWLKQIAGKVLLSVKHVVRRMEALEGTSMFHLVKYMTGKCMCNYSTFLNLKDDAELKLSKENSFRGEKMEASILKLNVPVLSLAVCTSDDILIGPLRYITACYNSPTVQQYGCWLFWIKLPVYVPYVQDPAFLKKQNKQTKKHEDCFTESNSGDKTLPFFKWRPYNLQRVYIFICVHIEIMYSATVWMRIIFAAAVQNVSESCWWAWHVDRHTAATTSEENLLILHASRSPAFHHCLPLKCLLCSLVPGFSLFKIIICMSYTRDAAWCTYRILVLTMKLALLMPCWRAVRQPLLR